MFKWGVNIFKKFIKRFIQFIFGQGDGNGILEGVGGTCYPCNYGLYTPGGEVGMFWVDPTYANGLNLNLIQGSFSTATPWELPNTAQYTLTGPELDPYFPAAKVGGGAYVYVWSGGISATTASNGVNYYEVSRINVLNGGCCMYALPAFTVAQAYAIDRKIDDGSPMSGRVLAMENVGYNMFWGNSDLGSGGTITSSVAATSQTCMDSNSGTTDMHYSTQINGGAGLNCPLAFQFK